MKQRREETELKNGKEQGKQETKKEVVINMHKKKFDIETICEITNLSKEEVEKIIKQEKYEKNAETNHCPLADQS